MTKNIKHICTLESVKVSECSVCKESFSTREFDCTLEQQTATAMGYLLRAVYHVVVTDRAFLSPRMRPQHAAICVCVRARTMYEPLIVSTGVLAGVQGLCLGAIRRDIER